MSFKFEKDCVRNGVRETKMGESYVTDSGGGEKWWKRGKNGVATGVKML